MGKYVDMNQRLQVVWCDQRLRCNDYVSVSKSGGFLTVHSIPRVSSVGSMKSSRVILKLVVSGRYLMTLRS